MRGTSSLPERDVSIPGIPARPLSSFFRDIQIFPTLGLLSLPPDPEMLLGLLGAAARLPKSCWSSGGRELAIYVRQQKTRQLELK